VDEVRIRPNQTINNPHRLVQLHLDEDWNQPSTVDPNNENYVWSPRLALGEKKWRDRDVVAG